MAVHLKALEDQIIVLTGASSGIGLATARMAAKRGARLVLAARNEEALRQLTTEIERNGGEAIYVVADVGDEAEVEGIATKAVEHFGDFDTWVNDAGISIYGQMIDVATADHRRMFETNFWGLVYGSLAAARHFRRRATDIGGSIVNVGSVLSDRAVPVQGMYSASKHAVKGFTEALRMELENEGVPVAVSLVKPSGINTPFTRHAKSYQEEEPSLPPPVYAPEVVAEAILHCAEHGDRDLYAGGGGVGIATLGGLAPRVVDFVMEAFFPKLQRKEGRPLSRDPEGALYGPAGGLQERGDYEGHVSESSVYTKAAMHPFLTAALAVGAGVALAGIVAAVKSSPARRPTPEGTQEFAGMGG